MPASFHVRPRLLRACTALLVLLLIAGCAAPDEPESGNPPTRTKAATGARTPTAKPNAAKAPTPSPRKSASRDDQSWLVMLYEDADDEILEEDMFNDLNEAELVGSSDRVRIVAQMDRYDGAFEGDGDWTSTKRFLVEQDDDLEHLGSTEVADLGEVNMADAETLIDFITWAVTTYPSDKYVLILSDHGAGWPGGWNDPDPEVEVRDDIPLAESFGDMLFLMELDDALSFVRAELGIERFELIGFDACLMSQLEVLSAVEPHARYAIASQEVEPSLGWAYAAFLGRLVDSPEIDGAELSHAIVDSYIEQDQQIIDDDARKAYVERTYEYEGELTAEEVAEEEGQSITLTAVDLSKLPPLIKALDALVLALQEADQKQVASARRYAESFESVFDEDAPSPYIDLGHFAKLAKRYIEDPAVDKAADNLLAAVEQAIINEKHGPAKAGATGVAIHFPNSELYERADSGVESYSLIASRFVEQSLWDNFLAYHYTGEEFSAGSGDEPVDAPEEEVEAPGAGAIEIAELQLSSDVVTIDEPLTIDTTVTGDNVAFIYIFVGYYDEASESVQIVDMDFLDAEETKEVDGVFYPDWGDEDTIELEIEWEPILYTIGDGTNDELALLDAQDYGAPDVGSTYVVEGIYTFAKSKDERYAQLLFQDGDLIQVLGATGDDDTGALREITPKKGDKFTILDQWIPLAEDEESEPFTQEGPTLTFGKENFSWSEVEAPEGAYLIGVIAEDLDGNLYESYEAVTVE